MSGIRVNHQMMSSNAEGKQSAGSIWIEEIEDLVLSRNFYCFPTLSTISMIKEYTSCDLIESYFHLHQMGTRIGWC
jgi:hypothetical protein